MSPTPLGYHINRQNFSINHNLSSAQKALGQIPANASVATQNNIGAHLSRRQTVVGYPNKSDVYYYIILHVKDPTSSIDSSKYFFHGTPSHKHNSITTGYKKVVEAAFSEENFGVIYFGDSWHVFKRGHDKSLNKAAYLSAQEDINNHLRNQKTKL